MRGLGHAGETSAQQFLRGTHRAGGNRPGQQLGAVGNAATASRPDGHVEQAPGLLAIPFRAGDFHRQRLEGFAFAARKPQRRARRRRARAPRGKAQGQEPRGKAFIQGGEAAVQAQAALHFEQQLARRLERNLRRELAGPRRDRFEGVRRQAGKVECEPEHGQAFSPRGGAARWPAFRGA